MTEPLESTKASLRLISKKGLIREVKAPPQADGVTVLAIIKNELFYLPAFLDHYRRLGVSRFVFLDDGSNDGGFEYLLQQPDCGVVVSELSFGQFVDGKKVHMLWRTALPQAYCEGTWSALVDIDEFIVLPPGFDSLASFTQKLDAMGAAVIGAVMIDFYPANVAELENAAPPNDASELFARYPFFDDCPHGRWARGRFRRAYGGVRARLLLAHGIAQAPTRMSFVQSIKSRLRKLMRRDKPQGFSAIYKVPLVRWSSCYEHVNPHRINAAPRADIQLPLVHFKFTGNFAEKIAFAISSGAYNNNSMDYRAYAELLEEMRRGDGSFLCEVSRKYSASNDFIANELVRFPGLGMRRLWSIR